MYVLTFMYPNEPGAEFDYEHFVNVHMPMGIHLTQKHLNIKPLKVICYEQTRGADLTPESARYIAISHVFFETKAAVETFATLFEFEEAARLLSDDFPNYTPHPPEVLVGRVHDLPSMDGLLEHYALTGNRSKR